MPAPTSMSGQLVPVQVPRGLAAIAGEVPTLFLPDGATSERFFDFLMSNIRNKNTRAYYKAACRFAKWCEVKGLHDLGRLKPLHIAAYVETLVTPAPEGAGFSKPTVKQHLAALRMLFDWLVVGQVFEVNPAHAVRGAKYRVKKGKTPVLNRDEARALLDSIAVTRKEKHGGGEEQELPSITGLRDRALIAMMLYTFARIGAVSQMNVRDYVIQGRRGRVRLHEKGGKEHEARATTSWRPISTNISPPPASRAKKMSRYSERPAALPAIRIV
jgi:site-specific recombinase XerD